LFDLATVGKSDVPAQIIVLMM